MMRAFLAAAALLLAVLPHGVRAQAPAAQIVVDVAVEDERGTPVRGLTASSFAVSVGGARWEVTSAREESPPLSLVLLLDRSRSMEDQANDLDRAVVQFASTLESSDRVRVAAFAGDITFSPVMTGDMEAVRTAIRRMTKTRGAGGSRIWDAIHKGVDSLASEPGRKVLLVVSDGRASGNYHGLDEIAQFALESGVSISALAPFTSREIWQDSTTKLVVRPAANLERLALFTGGLLAGGYDATVDPNNHVPTLAGRLRAGYSLTLSTASLDGALHRLEVAVNTPGVRVRAPFVFRARATASR